MQPMCQTLTRIYLNHNNFTELPDELMALTNLRKLDISFNRIAHIPSEIGDMQHLEYLWAEHNCITTIPQTIAKLHGCLSHLRVEHNALDFLPTELAQLTRLTVLGLEGVSKSAAKPPPPPAVVNMLYVKKGNPLKTLPKEVQQKAQSGDDKCIKRVRDYLLELKGDSKVFNRVKLMFVGDGGVGAYIPVVIELLNSARSYLTSRPNPPTTHTLQEKPLYLLLQGGERWR